MRPIFQKLKNIISGSFLTHFEAVRPPSITPHNTKQLIPPVTHHSINHANNPFPQYTNQLIRQPIRYGYPEADDAHTKTLVPLSSRFKLAGERVAVKR